MNLLDGNFEDFEKRAVTKLACAAPKLLMALKEHHRIAMKYHFDAYDGSHTQSETRAAIFEATGEKIS